MTSVQDSGSRDGRRVDRQTEQWVEQLRAGHPRRDHTVAKLRDVLRRVAAHELSRRRGQLRSITGPELAELADQAADDALLKILAGLEEFHGLSRFTTWAYKYVMFEVSAQVRRAGVTPPRGTGLDRPLRDRLPRSGVRSTDD
jgi:RNA polymerase sigma-70 factor, ECF subfamily